MVSRRPSSASATRIRGGDGSGILSFTPGRTGGSPDGDSRAITGPNRTTAGHKQVRMSLSKYERRFADRGQGSTIVESEERRR